MSIPRWCGVGHCRSRGRLLQLLAVGLVGRELLPHVPTSGLRVGGGAGGGAAQSPLAAAAPAAAVAVVEGGGGGGAGGGAEVAVGRHGRGPLELQVAAEWSAQLPLLLQAQAQVVRGEVCGAGGGGGGWLRRDALRGVAAAGVAAFLCLDEFSFISHL